MRLLLNLACCIPLRSLTSQYKFINSFVYLMSVLWAYQRAVSICVTEYLYLFTTCFHLCANSVPLCFYRLSRFLAYYICLGYSLICLLYSLTLSHSFGCWLQVRNPWGTEEWQVISVIIQQHLFIQPYVSTRKRVIQWTVSVPTFVLHVFY